MRGFQIVKGYEDKNIHLPKRQTTYAAGYDLEAAEDVIIPSMFQILISKFLNKIKFDNDKVTKEDNQFLKPTLVPTGLKAYMQEDEVLLIFNRSSGPIKRFLLLSNGTGVVDKDTYSSETDGDIKMQFINFGLLPVKIKKGERIAQGMFQKFLVTDYDRANKDMG
jgi:dUTP pyrophosphatase